MALSDLAVYSEYLYSAMTETVAQQVEKFNAASAGTVVLRAGKNQGDYSDLVKWKKISGLVRRRNAYGSGSVSEKVLENITDTMVKVAAGSPPVRIDPGMMTWILKDPKEAGVVTGTQLAGDMLADMLNTAVLAAYAAMVQTTAILYDATGDTPDTLTHLAMQKAAAKFGDRSQNIAAWITHSLPYHNLIGNNLANSAALFTYGTVSIRADANDRPFIITDTPSLINTAATPDTYHLLGLVPGAVVVEDNGDFLDNIVTSNGDENITRTWQSEWTYQLGIKGYAWDKASGGASPNDAALATSANWNKYVTSDKDGPGVILRVDFA